jgi:pimeloyl-ACP methyl ester carboxylesterase
MAHESEIAVPGGTLHVQRDGRGEPLLFLHGAQGLLGWEPALAALAEQFDVIVPDHPGFGRSAAVDGVDDLGDMALLYLDLLAGLATTNVHVVGHCIGGWLAMEIAIRNTARLKSLTLVDSAGLRLTGEPRADMFIVPQDELAKLLFAGDAGVAWLTAWQATPEQQDIYERNRAAAAKFSWHPRLCNPKLARWLHRIDVPTHVIWGEHDRVIPPAYATGLKDRIPGATMTALPGCGHLPQVERPREFADAVTRFIRRAAS